MPAVRSASGPINVPACEAPISMGMPSRAMRGFAVDIGFEIVGSGKAQRAHHFMNDWMRSARRNAPYASPYALRLEIRDLRRGREQPSRRRPQFAVLVAIALVENLGVGHRQHAGDVLGGEFLRRRRGNKSSATPCRTAPIRAAHERRGRRTHPTSTSATACRSFAARGRRSTVWRSARAARPRASRETRLALDEAEIILVGPGHRRSSERARLLERLGPRKCRLLVRPGRPALGEHGGRQRRDLAAALRHLHAPMLARAVGLDQPHVEIEGAFARSARRN